MSVQAKLKYHSKKVLDALGKLTDEELIQPNCVQQHLCENIKTNILTFQFIYIVHISLTLNNLLYIL